MITKDREILVDAEHYAVIGSRLIFVVGITTVAMFSEWIGVGRC